MFDEICLVWRQINAKISDLLDQDHRFLKILIDGPRGMGKSACLLQSLDQQLKKRNSDHLGKITDEKKLIDLKSDSSDVSFI